MIFEGSYIQENSNEYVQNVDLDNVEYCLYRTTVLAINITETPYDTTVDCYDEFESF